MAHDRQLAESSSEPSAASRQLKEHSAVVADWLTLYAQTYREEITEELALLYQQALRDIKPEILHKAFLRAAKNCKFRPTPAEVREAAETEMERSKPAYRLDGPRLSPAEREAVLQDPEYQRKKAEVLRKVGL